MVAIRARFSWKVATRTLCGVLLSSGMICTETASGGYPVRLTCGTEFIGGGGVNATNDCRPAEGPADLRGRTIVVVMEEEAADGDDTATQPAESTADLRIEDAEPATMQEALDRSEEHTSELQSH